MESQSEGEILMTNMAAAASIIHLMQVKKKGKRKKGLFLEVTTSKLHLGISNFLQNMKLNLNDLHIKIRH